jgi:hypothetical protein
MEYEFEDEPKPENGSEKMEQEPRTSELVDTTDCLEAISVIRCWKNLLFIIILLVLLLLQLSFWFVSIGWIKADEVSAAAAIVQPAVEAKPDMPGPETEPEQPQQVSIKVIFEPKIKHVKAVVRFLNFILIPCSLLYCLSMLFALKISLIGRLGGINHITRAFFLSLVFVVLLLPWQIMFAPVFAGAMFTSTELINACQAQKTWLAYVSFYLRFFGYWLLVLLLLLFTQIRSMRWARATLRRLEVV